MVQKLEAEDTPGKNLLFYRKMQKLTQAQLGAKIDVAKQFFSDMERDYKPISRQMAKRLAGIFSVDAGRFI
ncbi:MAG: helix-turn-helix transcriptional regulator [Sphaerochaeta sp.]|nr:helix-turn-helix transcriptional regulator [Sphaerochaeta sp.]